MYIFTIYFIENQNRIINLQYSVVVAHSGILTIGMLVQIQVTYIMFFGIFSQCNGTPSSLLTVRITIEKLDLVRLDE